MFNPTRSDVVGVGRHRWHEPVRVQRHRWHEPVGVQRHNRHEPVGVQRHRWHEPVGVQRRSKDAKESRSHGFKIRRTPWESSAVLELLFVFPHAPPFPRPNARREISKNFLARPQISWRAPRGFISPACRSAPLRQRREQLRICQARRRKRPCQVGEVLQIEIAHAPLCFPRLYIYLCK